MPMLGLLIVAGVAALAIWVAAVALFGMWMAYLVYHPPMPVNAATPAAHGLAWERWRVRAGARGDPEIDAWWIPAPAAAATILIMHEWGSQKANKVGYASFLHARGFSVLMFDMRNHGASGRHRGMWHMSAKYTRDMLAVIDRWRAAGAGADASLGILAFSFSTWPALYYGAVHCPPELDAIVLDSGPPADVGRTAARFIDLYGDRWIPRVLRLPPWFSLLKRVYVGTLQLMLDGHWPPPLDGLRAATLFITGEHDQLMPPAEVRRTVALVGGTSQVWVVPGCPHLKAFNRRDSEYRAVVGDFFSAHVQANRLRPKEVSSV